MATRWLSWLWPAADSLEQQALTVPLFEPPQDAAAKTRQELQLLVAEGSQCCEAQDHVWKKILQLRKDGRAEGEAWDTCLEQDDGCLKWMQRIVRDRYRLTELCVPKGGVQRLGAIIYILCKAVTMWGFKSIRLQLASTVAIVHRLHQDECMMHQGERICACSL